MYNLLVPRGSLGIIVTQRQKVFKSQTSQLPFQATTFLLYCITIKNNILSFFASLIYIFNDKIVVAIDFVISYLPMVFLH
jgi:hypothetical protein